MNIENKEGAAEPGCKLGCTDACKAKEHGCASECPALPWQPAAVMPPAPSDAVIEILALVRSYGDARQDGNDNRAAGWIRDITAALQAPQPEPAAGEQAGAVALPDPLGCNACTHPDCGRFNGPRSVECRAMADNACARKDAAPGAAIAAREQTPREQVERIVHLRTDRARRVYIAGPMTGLPEHNFPAFNAKAAELRAAGWHVENPAEHGHIDGAVWGDYLRWDISRLATCGTIYLLPGWQSSKGAGLEVHIAKTLGMEFRGASPLASPKEAPATPEAAPSSYINGADIGGNDAPIEVVRKLDAEFRRRQGER